MDNTKYNFFKHIALDPLELCSNKHEVAKKGDDLVVLTGWNQFRNLDLDCLSQEMNEKRMFDFRNVYDRALVESKGFFCKRLGR